MPTGAIPTQKKNNLDNKEIIMPTTAIPTLIPNTVIPTTHVNCGDHLSSKLGTIETVLLMLVTFCPWFLADDLCANK
jgi:hypothetical protein